MGHVELFAPRLNGLHLSEPAKRDVRDYSPSDPLYHEAIDYLADQLRSQDDFFHDYTHGQRKKVVKHYVVDLEG